MASEFALIHFSALVEDPRNIRKSYTSIDELAHTINEYGLLQNLITTRLGEDRFIVKDGNRRKRAIGHLISLKLWDENKPVPCYILDNDGSFEQIIAEVQKQEAPIWHIGFRFNEFQDMGMNQEQISARIGKSRGYVGRAQQISANLAPETIKRLDTLPVNTFTISQVCQISKLINPASLEPDKQAQLAKIETLLELPRRVRKQLGKAKNKDLTARFYKLKTKLKIPLHAAPIVNAIIQYLDGETTHLKF